MYLIIVLLVKFHFVYFLLKVANFAQWENVNINILIFVQQEQNSFLLRKCLL